MGLFDDETPYCRRCEYELQGRRDTCPRCQFSPKNRGLRVALGFLLVVVVAMSVAMFVPGLGRILLVVAGLSFLSCVVSFAVSFVATPYRLGSLFLRE